MSSTRVTLAVLSLLVALPLAGCDRAGDGSSLIDPAIALDDVRRGDRDEAPEFDPEDFVARVDNPYFPLVPGTVFHYASVSEEGTETIEVEVTRQSKRILGIAATVVHDRVFFDGELIEDTFDWYGQDEDGNVWYLGEDTKELEDGVVVSTEGSWEAGKDGARAGILMLAHPERGDSYAQEVAPGVAEDRAKVIALDRTVVVPHGRFTNCLQTYETTPLDRSSKEDKYYARGIGHVLAVSRRSGQREELVSVTTR